MRDSELYHQASELDYQMLQERERQERLVGLVVCAMVAFATGLVLGVVVAGMVG